MRLTVIHDPGYDPAGAGDANGAVLCDADLAVLAGEHYDAYARAVREEYRHVPTSSSGRAGPKVLRRPARRAPPLSDRQGPRPVGGARQGQRRAPNCASSMAWERSGVASTSPAAARNGRDQAEQQLT
ncbi:hypothetical protein GCM10020219_056220 [Nonomuraea dietziae]